MTASWRKLAAALLFGGSTMTLAAVPAAAFPDKQVTIVVGVQPGGGIDVLARVLAQELQKKWGQPVVVENRAGAEETVGADFVARAPADGHTLFMASSSHTIPKKDFKPPYDPVKSFTPITFVALQPQILAVNNATPFKSLPELIAHAKANPGKLNFGSGGEGTPTYVTTALLMQRAGIDMVNVSYRGGAPTLAGLINGEIQLMFGSVTTMLASVQGDKVRPLAVSSAKRFPGTPDVPTVAEAANLPGFEVQFWFGVLGPAGVPAATVAKLNTDFVVAIKSDEVQKNLQTLGYVTVASSSAELGKMMADDVAQWERIGKK